MQKIGFCDKYSLTQAVLNGTKTMTRRLIPSKVMEYALTTYREEYYQASLDTLSDKECLEGWLITEKHSHYKLGEVVAVAQAYKDIEEYNPESYEDVMLDQGTICESSHPYSHLMKSGGWDNKMFVRADLMPHRIQIMDVSIERLQAISDDDCLKEGILKNHLGYYWFYGFTPSEGGRDFKTPREAFATLINRPGVGRKGLWESNPFVVVYQFKLVK